MKDEELKKRNQKEETKGQGKKERINKEDKHLDGTSSGLKFFHVAALLVKFWYVFGLDLRAVCSM